jgi:flavin-dependent dehydrogenase
LSTGREHELTSRLWDVLVVGAGPAGSMVARELALGGADVLLVDRQAFPRWKVCGACLSPGTQSVLREAGLGHIPLELGSVPLHSLRLSGWDLGAEVSLRGSVALSRAAFDEALAMAAVEAGVTFVAPARALPGGLEPDARRVLLNIDGVDVTARARVVIAADGVASAFLSGVVGRVGHGASSGSRIGLGAVYGQAVPGYEPGFVHMGVGSAGYVGLVRLEDGAVDVACALDPARLGEHGRPEDLVQEILIEAGMAPLPGDPLAGWKGTPLLTRSPVTRGGERLFAVGDAAGYVEPFTGEGITWALSGARALAPIAAMGVSVWNPRLVATWDRAYQHTVGKSAALCRGVAWGLRRPVLARAGLRVLGVAPFVAAPFVRRASRAPVPHSRRS